ncbi:hypothetical protein [Streptomyces sp. NPDC047071]|uniref:hypothetical protein n=1 Tax=Streptomyces sp. NPDC047071 TaxID=3154808 RepID=UPI003453DB8B
MYTLLSVGRRRRYLPFVAGMLADVLLVSVRTLVSVGLRRTGVPGWFPALCLAVCFTCVLRLVRQFLFHLETGLYYVATTALRCTDLQNATRFHCAPSSGAGCAARRHGPTGSGPTTSAPWRAATRRSWCPATPSRSPASPGPPCPPR